MQGKVLVTMFNVAPWGGLHENVWYSSVGMKARGWDVTVACRPGPIVKRLQADGVRVHLVRNWDRWRRDAALLGREHWDLVHTHPFSSRELGLRVAKLAGAPVVSTFHGFNTDDLDRWSKRPSVLMAVSQAHAEMLQSVPGVHRTAVQVVPNAVRDELLRPPVLTWDQKSVAGERRVVVASRLDPDKRALIDCVKAVLAALPEHDTDRWVVELLGGGSADATIRQMLGEVVGDRAHVRVDLAGWVDSEDVPARLRPATLAIASGRGAAQAMAVGTPVVAFGSQGIYGLQSGANLRTGLWGNFGGFPLADRPVSDVTSDVALLLSDPEHYAHVQREGRTAVAEDLRQSEVDRRLARVYRQARRPRPSTWARTRAGLDRLLVRTSDRLRG